ncbi:Uncharacterized protein C56G2.3 [Toxocara canis]|uniref:Uncharacterized protein C56G2.3 n=1 Tax=Toxocara canis TaxID=6265 RepID=A0A0B2W039_TOXCA|nr:Uncharacterized protein C56G2.3 [Toxocara canis]
MKAIGRHLQQSRSVLTSLRPCLNSSSSVSGLHTEVFGSKSNYRGTYWNEAKLSELEKRSFAHAQAVYGRDVEQFIFDPFRNEKRLYQLYGGRIWNTIRLDEKPHIVFDMKPIEAVSEKRRSDIGHQMQLLISENFERAEPFRFIFANFNDQREENKQLLHNSVGSYNDEYANEIILPDFINKSAEELYPNEKEIIYISRYGEEVLDGPLGNKVYVIDALYDSHRESNDAKKKEKFRVMRFPFERYLGSRQTPQYLSLTNMIRILDEVYQSNGDWKNALLHNFSRYDFTQLHS